MVAGKRGGNGVRTGGGLLGPARRRGLRHPTDGVEPGRSHQVLGEGQQRTRPGPERGATLGVFRCQQMARPLWKSVWGLL